MREIKFRIWDAQEKEIIRNEDIKSLDFRANYFHTEMIDGDFFGDEYDYKLMQYIGLNDVKGREIYEGDILKCSSMLYPDMVNVGIVEYRKGEFQIRWINDNESVRWDIRFWVEERVAEVIGNIYKNQEIISAIKSL